MALIGHILKAGLDPGPWTLDSGLWTLDSGFFLLKLYSPPRKKLLYLPPPKKPLYPTHETPPINISPLNIVCEFSNKQRYSPHPPPRKNLCLPFKTAPSQKTPLPPPPNKKYNYIGIDWTNTCGLNVLPQIGIEIERPDPNPLKKVLGVRTWLHYTTSKDQIKFSIHRCDVYKLLSAASDNVVYLRCYSYSCFQSSIKYCLSLK